MSLKSTLVASGLGRLALGAICIAKLLRAASWLSSLPFRGRIPLIVLSLLLTFSASGVAFAQGFVVSTSADCTSCGSLRDAIAFANTNPNTAITFSNAIAGSTITVTTPLPLILGNNTSIDGGSNNITVSGGSISSSTGVRVFFIGDAGQTGNGTTNATISNLTIANANARGGDGTSSGGGGAGLGGAIFVSSTGALTLSNVALHANSATGGAGGTGDPPNNGGGGGMGGNAGAACCIGGGGGFGDSASGGAAGGGNGIAGSFTNGARGGATSSGSNGGVNGGGGGGGTGLVAGGGGGVGGGTSSGLAGGNGGFGGGGGGFAGNGGFGGGGAGSFTGLGGNGGFGGGGAGTHSTGAMGGFGGGTGGDGAGSSGGGGAGLGGAIFVTEGGQLVLAGSLTVNGNRVTAGAAGGAGATSGSALGSGLFLQGSGNIIFQPDAGKTATIANGIADQTGSGGIGTFTSGGPNCTPGASTPCAGYSGTGSWSLTMNGGGTLRLSGFNTYTGGTTISAGTLVIAPGGSLGISSNTTTVNGGTLDLGGTGGLRQAHVNLAGGTIQNGALNAPITSTGGTIDGLGGVASLTTTSGTTFVTGTNTFNGPANVNGGILNVIGSMTDPTVNAGGTLMGTGSVGASQINSGGTFAPGSGFPGSSMTVSGNLAFQSGAIYLVQVNPTTSSFASVTGTATPGGATVNAMFASGTYVVRQYTILTATGGVSGTFGSIVNTNLPSGFKTSLSYNANNVFLDLALQIIPPPGTGSPPGTGLNINQQNVANAVINAFNSSGSIPLVFGGLTPAGLTQLSGEGATASQQSTFDAMGQFMGLLTDPFMGRGNGINGATAPTGFAEETGVAYVASRKPTDAVAMFTKALPAPFAQRWSVWAAGYGGSQTTGGNAIVGSNDATSRIAGTVVGADYLFSPNTLAGFALAGGGTSFSVNNLGSGRSDLFQAGAYIRHTQGPGYITGALAYGWQDISTNRTVTVAGLDQMRAEFNANAYSGRVEGGYRFVAPWVGGVGLTPYAAGQFTTFDLPAYMEETIGGSNQFALAYNSKSVTDTRSELGLRSDKSFAMANGIVTLRGRLAWAHDFNPDRSIAATFQTLPGASFVVNGAAQASDSALTTVSAEWNWMNGWSAAATFEGEFSNVTGSYAGKGLARYQW